MFNCPLTTINFHWEFNNTFLLLKVATVSERSRIMELERDLSLRKREVADLKLHLETQQGSDNCDSTVSSLLEEIKSQREQLASLEAQQQEKVASYEEKLEAQEKANSEAAAQLQATSVRLSGDKEQLQMRLSCAEKEHADAEELWRSKLEAAMVSHKEALEELRASFSKGAGEQAEELLEAKSTLETLKQEHQAALEEASSLREAEARAWSLEMQALSTQMAGLTQEKERLEEALRSSVERAEEQHLVEMEDVLGKLHTAELRVKELEEKEEAAAALGQQETKEQEGQVVALQIQLAQGHHELVTMKSQLDHFQSQNEKQSAMVGNVYSFTQLCAVVFIMWAPFFQVNVYFKIHIKFNS